MTKDSLEPITWKGTDLGSGRMMRFTFALIALLALALGASAAPITWTLSGVTLDGGAVSGSFTFNAEAGTLCTTGNSPCGTYGNVDISTTAGGGLASETYTNVCGGPGGVSACNGLSPDSTEVLFLTSNASNQSGLQAIVFIFTQVGVPPSGLTDNGGTINMNDASFSVGEVIEGVCSNSACSSANSKNVSNAGVVTTQTPVPEPSSALLLGGPLALFVLVRLRSFRHSRRGLRVS
jgi:hypothetical protein